MINNKIKKAVSLVSSAALLASAMPVLSFADNSVQLYINEVCTSNAGENGNLTGAVDKKGEYCDWIELYNAGSEAVSLNGFTLVKDDKDSYSFENVTIAAGEYKIVYCCKTYNGDETIPHAAFNLSSDGVKLTLKNGDETLDTAEVPALDVDTVWGRRTDGGEFTYLYPTPSFSNNDAESAVPCNAPEFDRESGMYDQSFELTLSTDEGNKIYYTLDGTDPVTSKTRKEYTAPVNIYNRSGDKAVLANYLRPSQISPWAGDWQKPSNNAIDKGTVIRAVTLSSANEYSEVITKTYFVGVSNKDHNGLPILSVTTDPESLFNYETGIYRLGKVYDEIGAASADPNNPDANYNRKGSEWERACHIDFFEGDGTLVLSQDCGMRTQGAYSRADYQKSLRFYARDEYGEKNFKYTFFDNAYQENGSGKQLKKFKRLVMRNGGNDTSYTKLKDSFLQSLVSDKSFDTQEGRPCVMYIDGEYWGLYTLQENYDDHYFEENYDVNSDEVVVYKRGEIDEGNDEDIELFYTLRNYAQSHNLSNSTYYNEICKMIDVKSFAEYMATEIYIGNQDWPGNNYAMWRTRTVDESNPYADGRWRMLLYDIEMSCNHYGGSDSTYTIDNLKYVLNNSWDDLPVIFNSLMKNAKFKALFVNSLMDIANISFDYDRAMEVLEPLKAEYFPELEKSFARFPSWANINNAAEPCISNMSKFLKNRRNSIKNMAAGDLGLSSAKLVAVNTVNPDGGEVTLNLNALDTSKTFKGYYFDEYKITLKAQAKEGYVFKGWAGSYVSSNAEITIKASDAAALQAVFAKDNETLVKVTITDGSKSLVTYAAAGTEMFLTTTGFSKTGYTTSLTPSEGTAVKNTTAKIKYTPVTYNIRFYPAGGTGSSYTQTLTYDKAAALKANTFKRTGYTFMGWATSAGASSALYTNKQSVKNLTSVQNKTIFLYAVWKKKISAATLSLSAGSYYYSGKNLAPTVTVKIGSTKLVKGTDYTVTYTNNKAIGKATVTVKGKGKYTGSKSITFKIVPRGTTIKTYSSPKAGSFKVTYTKVTGITAYQITYATDSAFTKNKVSKSSAKLTKTITGLKKGTYYVKVRTYKTVNGTRYYSPYTKAVKITVK